MKKEKYFLYFLSIVIVLTFTIFAKNTHACETNAKDLTAYHIQNLKKNKNVWARFDSIRFIGYHAQNSFDVIQALEKSYQQNEDETHRAYVLWALATHNPKHPLVMQSRDRLHEKVISNTQRGVYYLASHTAYLAKAGALKSPSQKQHFTSLLVFALQEIESKEGIPEAFSENPHNLQPTKIRNNLFEHAEAVFAFHEIGTPEALKLKNQILDVFVDYFFPEEFVLFSGINALGRASLASEPYLMYLEELIDSDDSVKILKRDYALQAMLSVSPTNEKAQHLLKHYLKEKLEKLDSSQKVLSKWEIVKKYPLHFITGTTNNTAISKHIKDFTFFLPYSQCALPEIRKTFEQNIYPPMAYISAAKFIQYSGNDLSIQEMDKIKDIGINTTNEKQRVYIREVKRFP